MAFDYTLRTFQKFRFGILFFGSLTFYKHCLSTNQNVASSFLIAYLIRAQPAGINCNDEITQYVSSQKTCAELKKIEME